MQKCYALALSSGDQNSMFQAGALKGLATNMDASEMAYSAVSGTSGGAVNAVWLANYPAGQEEAAADAMKAMWDSSATTKLYKDWLGGLAQGLLLKGGLWNDKAILDWVSTQMADVSPTQRFIDIGLTDVLSGTYVDYLQDQLTGDALNEVMYAQFAQAGMFPPVEYNNTEYFSGSTIWDLDVFSVVNQCVSQGYELSDVVVDVLLTSDRSLKTVDASSYNSIEMLFRYLVIERYYGAMDGLLRAQFAYPDVTFRHVVMPSDHLPNSIYPLNMTADEVTQIYTQGVTDGTAAAQGAGNNVSDLTHYYSLKKKGDKRVRGGVSYEQFLEKKANGHFEDFDLHSDKLLAAMFLQ